MKLDEVRIKLAAVLAPIEDTDPEVLPSVVDSIEPPALILTWAEPWLEPDTACISTGRLVVIAVAARLMPGEGMATLEELVAYTLGRLRADSGAWPMESVSGPRVINIAKTNYLAARVTVRVTIT